MAIHQHLHLLLRPVANTVGSQFGGHHDSLALTQKTNSGCSKPYFFGIPFVVLQLGFRMYWKLEVTPRTAHRSMFVLPDAQFRGTLLHHKIYILGQLHSIRYPVLQDLPNLSSPTVVSKPLDRIQKLLLLGRIEFSHFRHG